MKEKLKEMDDIIADIYANMGQHDAIVVGGDHGMTDVFVENKSIRNGETLDYHCFSSYCNCQRFFESHK